MCAQAPQLTTIPFKFLEKISKMLSDAKFTLLKVLEMT